MNKLKVIATTVLSAALVPWAAGVAEAANFRATIDPLTTEQKTTRENKSGSNDTTKLNIPGTIFNSPTTTPAIDRKLTVTKQGGTGLGEAKIPTVNFGPGLEINNITGVDSEVKLQYGTNKAVNTFSTVDFTVGGLANRVSLGIIANDTGSTDTDTKFTVTINGVSVTKELSDKSSKDPVLPLDFLFSNFTAINSTFNPASVTSFSVTFNPAVEGDIAVSFLEVRNQMPMTSTPEPASLLGLLAVAGAVSTLRKKEHSVK